MEYCEDFSNAGRIVATEGLRLRRTPNGRILRSLTIGDPVVDLGDAGQGWRKVRAAGEEGVVFAKYLRAPRRREVEALLRATVDEWLRFDKGRGREAAEPYRRYVREMWARLGLPHDGRSDVAWSAAFISWVVHKASGAAGGAYDGFRFSAQHSVFVNSAIKARIAGHTDKPFWGYRIGEVRPEPGDIVQLNRGGAAFSFSHAESHASYPSHSDIVVEVTPDVARVIGGNVGNTVSLSGGVRDYDLDANGFIRPGQRVIAILKNRTGMAAA